MVYLLTPSVCGARTYVGASADFEALDRPATPWRRLMEHNGLKAGGVARLTSGRPWRMVAWVGGFPTWKHALKFERAWQLGMKAAEIFHVAGTAQASRGVLRKMEVLRALLYTPAWYLHGLHVTFVCLDPTSERSAQRERAWWAPMGEYPFQSVSGDQPM